MNEPPNLLDRALGCLLGHLAGDALGSLVEFKTAEQIKTSFPNGVREMADGGTFNTIAGQPTDASEMALALAQSLMRQKTYDATAAQNAYKNWFYSRPFDCGRTISNALSSGLLDETKQGAGALMRISPLGIFCARKDISNDTMMNWARQDAKLTHPNKICCDANLVYVRLLAHIIRDGLNTKQAITLARDMATSLKIEAAVQKAVRDGLNGKCPENYEKAQGKVLIALQNALYQLRSAKNIEDGIADTISHGGDTDANAAIAGALLGAVYGAELFPAQWKETLVNCQASLDNPRVRHPRPQVYWPSDALRLPARLLDLPA